MTERLCAGCGRPIEPGADGATRYSSMMRLDGGPAERVHSDPDCKLRHEVWQRQMRVTHEHEMIAKARRGLSS